MTRVAFASVKGAPGVTTLTCLVGATWPEQRKVMVVECDPSGGDLAARFLLSSRIGWPSLTSAARRSPSVVPIGPHLQQLPGGLDVLTGTGGMEPSEVGAGLALLSAASPPSAGPSKSEGPSSSDGPQPSEGPWDLLVDLGRLLPGGIESTQLQDQVDAVVIVLRSDAASVMRVRERIPADGTWWSERLGLALVGAGCHSAHEVERFTGIPVLAELPFDVAAAGIASGERNGERKLSRSLLATAAGRLALTLATRSSFPAGLGSLTASSDGERDAAPRPSTSSHRPAKAPFAASATNGR